MAGDRELELQIEGRKYNVRILSLGSETASVVVDGKKIEVAIRDLSAKAVSPGQSLGQTPQPSQPSDKSAQAPTSSAPAVTPADSSLQAMMPGTVLKLHVTEGQKVLTGDVILVLEAMKMENEVRSDRSGNIEKIHVSAGQQVQTGDPLISFS